MQALMFAFPEIEWFPWKFVGEQLPAGWWENMDNQRWFLDWLRKHVLKSDSLESLYSVTTNVIRQHGGTPLPHSPFTRLIALTHPCRRKFT